VVDRVDGNHNKLLNSLSEKFQFVVDSNKNTTSEILEVILAQHNQTRHELASRTDALALMHQQLLNVTLTQMKTVAQDCSLDVLAKIFPRLDAINATLRLNLDKEIALRSTGRSREARTRSRDRSQRQGGCRRTTERPLDVSHCDDRSRAVCG